VLEWSYVKTMTVNWSHALIQFCHFAAGLASGWEVYTVAADSLGKPAVEGYV
jgi:hypothetical protein